MSDEAVPSTRVQKEAHFAWGPFILTIVADVMVAWCLYSVFYGNIPPENQRIADVLVGNVVIAWAAARGYWYQTTYGSQAKDRIIAQSEPVKPS